MERVEKVERVERVKRVFIHAGHFNKTQEEREKELFLLLLLSICLSLTLFFRSGFFSGLYGVYDTSNNILKLSIQLVHIYGNLVKA